MATLTLQRAAILVSLGKALHYSLKVPSLTDITATSITAQGGFGNSGYSSFGGSSSSSSDSDSNTYSSNPYSSSNSNSNGGSGRGGFSGDYADRGRTIIVAHAVLATLAFGFFFPVGGIMIRLGSFPGLWIVHGLFQIFGLVLYTVAFGIGIWMTKNFYTLNDAHPIIGIVLFALLAFQPMLGFLHHVFFKRTSARTIWSYGHIWFGRIAIILGIVNGGLGLGLAKRTGHMVPSQSAVIGYAVVAGFFGVAYILSAIYGERKRGQSSATHVESQSKGSESGSERERSPREAPRREYYKTEKGYVRRASHSRHSGPRRASRGQGYA
jgi:hypothetical protein